MQIKKIIIVIYLNGPFMKDFCKISPYHVWTANLDSLRIRGRLDGAVHVVLCPRSPWWLRFLEQEERVQIDRTGFLPFVEELAGRLGPAAGYPYA